MIMAQSLFACTKCHKRYPLNKLSGVDMQCMRCKSGSSMNSTSANRFLEGPVKCTFCRDEYTSTDDSDSICQKCQQNVKQHGKPRACQICNIIAAFIGNKCQRCVFSERKWGSPVQCDQCKQRCAFNRDTASKRKVEGRTLCWLCTIAFKRVLAKARKKDSSSLFSSDSSESLPKRKRSSDSLKTLKGDYRSSEKSASSANGSSSQSSSIADYPLPDMNIVLVTKLREEVESLKKTIQQKDQQLLEKERKMTELKAAQMDNEKKSREKILAMQKQHADTVDTSQAKHKDLLKQIAALTREAKSKKITSVNGGQSGTASPAAP